MKKWCTINILRWLCSLGLIIWEKETKTVSKLYMGFHMLLCFFPVDDLEIGLYSISVKKHFL